MAGRSISTIRSGIAQKFGLIIIAIAFAWSVGLADARAQTPAGPQLPAPIIDEAPLEGYRSVVIEGARVAYVERGSGRPIIFIHGNPSSSYLWRSVIPYVEAQGRVIALDLAGTGSSEPARLGYRFADHARRLDAFIEALDLRDQEDQPAAIGHVLSDWLRRN